MKENPNIDELLNSFIDGELSTRQLTEVQRLIANDKQVAQRLGELKNCKVLVGSLPPAEAPAEMVSRIKASLAKETLLTQPAHVTERFDRRVGARHLLARNIVAAAAMIALVAGLVLTVYTIIGPETTPEGVLWTTDRPVAVEQWQPPVREVEVAVAEKPIARPAAPAARFNGRLEVKTGDLVAVNAFINRAIEDNGLSGCVSSEVEDRKSVYTINCSRQAFGLLLADLEYVWPRFDSPTLSVETGRIGDRVVVDEVSTEQIAGIINQGNLNNCIKTARDFAVLNNMTLALPGKEVLAAIGSEAGHLITIPKPVLTSNERPLRKPATQTEDGEKLSLTIVISAGE